jgi:hypothetical protein
MYSLAGSQDYQDFCKWQDELFDELSLEAGFESAGIETETPGRELDIWDTDGEAGLDNLTLTAMAFAQRSTLEETIDRLDDALAIIAYQQSLLKRLMQFQPAANRHIIMQEMRAEYPQYSQQLAPVATVNVDSEQNTGEQEQEPIRLDMVAQARRAGGQIIPRYS